MIATVSKAPVSALIRYARGEGRDENGDQKELEFGEQSRSEAIGTIGLGEDVSPELAIQFMEQQAESNRQIKNNGTHLILSWEPGMLPARDEYMEAALGAANAIGMPDAIGVVYRHEDKEHSHIHVVASRINPKTGKAYDDRDTAYRAIGWSIEWEEEHGIPASRQVAHDQANAVRARDYDALAQSLAKDGLIKEAELNVALARGGKHGESLKEARGEFVQDQGLTRLKGRDNRTAAYATQDKWWLEDGEQVDFERARMPGLPAHDDKKDRSLLRIPKEPDDAYWDKLDDEMWENANDKHWKRLDKEGKERPEPEPIPVHHNDPRFWLDKGEANRLKDKKPTGLPPPDDKRDRSLLHVPSYPGPTEGIRLVTDHVRQKFKEKLKSIRAQPKVEEPNKIPNFWLSKEERAARGLPLPTGLPPPEDKKDRSLLRVPRYPTPAEGIRLIGQHIQQKFREKMKEANVAANPVDPKRMKPTELRQQMGDADPPKSNPKPLTPPKEEQDLSKMTGWNDFLEQKRGEAKEPFDSKQIDGDYSVVSQQFKPPRAPQSNPTPLAPPQVDRDANKMKGWSDLLKEQKAKEQARAQEQANDPPKEMDGDFKRIRQRFTAPPPPHPVDDNPWKQADDFGKNSPRIRLSDTATIAQHLRNKAMERPMARNISDAASIIGAARDGLKGVATAAMNVWSDRQDRKRAAEIEQQHAKDFEDMHHRIMTPYSHVPNPNAQYRNPHAQDNNLAPTFHDPEDYTDTFKRMIAKQQQAQNVPSNGQDQTLATGVGTEARKRQQGMGM